MTSSKIGVPDCNGNLIYRGDSVVLVDNHNYVSRTIKGAEYTVLDTEKNHAGQYIKIHGSRGSTPTMFSKRFELSVSAVTPITEPDESIYNDLI